ncbi:MAG: DUF4007 family protein [Chloroflexi bacterium]|uniref:DUF4007 family protein n=1 Tax=Candidatus Chlorohelix allophototropha TaxID=3003348 RepID=A0A8T7M4W5_9CHLR|nr:DUF4007 family protein [Chloroflexota bacterium]WJW70258.1 DUF4007 family protein [Chloroflexota bacterium L227-S17]
MRFSGHETFICRYTWLPKACSAIAENPSVLTNDEEAMVKLGVGKNMVNSIRFWVEVMGVAIPNRQQKVFNLTTFGRRVFSEDGFDPYLENIQTLWLLHWHLSSRKADPIFAWNFLLNRWPYPELSRSEVVTAFEREGKRLGYSHSSVTLAQHLDIFLRTYLPSQKRTAIEDSLDSPFVELALLRQSGQRRIGLKGPLEDVYLFRREAKPELTKAVFEYCLDDYWNRWHQTERTLTFRDIAVAECSIGQVFKLPEDDLRTRLELYVMSGVAQPFEYQLSAVQGQVTRNNIPDYDFLATVYETGYNHG